MSSRSALLPRREADKKAPVATRVFVVLGKRSSYKINSHGRP